MPSKTATPKRPAKPRKSIAEKALELRKLKADTEKSELDLDEARDAAGTRGLNRRKLEIEAEVAELELQQERINLAAMERANEYEASHPSYANTYTFYSDVDKANVAKAMFEIAQWARRQPGCDITVVFNSPGGSVLDGFAFYDFLLHLRDSGHEITTLVFGEAASMGGILLQAGSKRIMGRNAWLLIHEVAASNYGKFADMQDFQKWVKRLQDQGDNILSERSSLTPTQIRQRSRKNDWWLSADEALKFGFVDEVK